MTVALRSEDCRGCGLHPAEGIVMQPVIIDDMRCLLCTPCLKKFLK